MAERLLSLKAHREAVDKQIRPPGIVSQVLRTRDIPTLTYRVEIARRAPVEVELISSLCLSIPLPCGHSVGGGNDHKSALMRSKVNRFTDQSMTTGSLFEGDLWTYQ